MTTRTNTELNDVVSYSIANSTYTRASIIQCIRESKNCSLNLALDCCLDEGTLDEALAFFINNPHYYPEAQLLNNVHNHHVLQRNAMQVYAYGNTDYIALLPAHLVPTQEAAPTESSIFA